MIMKKKSLIICNTPYQVILAMKLAMDCTKEELMDLAVTDMFSGAEKIAERLNRLNIFQNVYFVRDKAIQDGKSIWSKMIKVVSLLFCRISTNKIWKNGRIPVYDRLYYCVPNLFMHNTFVQLKKRNPHVEVVVYEEGYSTYTGTVGSQKTDMVVDLRCRFLGFPRVEDSLKAVYLFEPELLIYDYKAPVVRISRDTFFQPVFIQNIKDVFDISESVSHDYDRTYVLIEEAFYMKHPEIDDLELYEKIISCIGKENIMVKSHPRSVTNRFERFEVKTNKEKGIPWEALLLTQNFQGKTLFALSSGSVINAGLCLGTTVNSFLLYKCLKNRPDQLDADFEEFVKKYSKRYPDTIHVFDDIDSVIRQLT